MKILAIDGNSIMNRAFYGIKALSTSKGEYTNALTGFMNIYLKELEAVQPDCAAVAFDLKAPTFRHKSDAAYKANRKGMPHELALQMPLIKEILADLGVKTLECEGFEADDILGTLSEIFGNGDECVILTGDRDSLQLVSESCTVRLATNRETVVYTPDKFREDYGLEPIQLIELKALMGDSSDNISGVKGIGEKTAAALIKEQGSVEQLYENLDSMKLTPSVRKKLESGHEDAVRSKFLATIVKNAPIERDTAAYTFGERKDDELKMLLSRLEMNKLMARLGLTGNAENAPQPVKTDDLPPLKTAELTADNLPNGKSAFTFDGKKLCVQSGETVYHTDDEQLILKYFTAEGEKVCFDGKTAHRWAFEHGGELRGLTFSCDLAGYLLNSQASEYTAENLCLAYRVAYRADMGEFADVCSLIALAERLTQELEAADMTALYNDIELPLCETLASMEYYGVDADADGIRAFGDKLNENLGEITDEIYRLAGQEFNISSPKQLGKVLFEDLRLPCKKKTKSGYSTNAEVLESIANKHPIVPMILEYRTLSKLSSTYVDSLLKQIHADGRVHSIFKQTETRTGRISSTEPNMQNIPVRKELGREMRRFFIAREGCLLVDADYSQIELRVLASVCGDENMQQAFLSGSDIHTSTAAQVFGLPEDFVSPEMRSAAKAVNFGIIYGIGPFSLSKDIGVSVAEAKKYIQSYLDNYPKVTEFMNKTIADGEKNGYVSTIFGRRRYIPELSASNKNVQAFGKRAAMNAPIQGAAADIIKLAMVKVYRRLKAELPEVHLILQVHDELILEAPEAQAERAAALLKEEMEAAVKLAVPLTVDVHTGKSWYDAKG
ncbi:DNA polymerase I [Ruminococcus sp. 210702-SL.1.03]|uniref:DNA polymerase I n=1 Tax=Ruminococcus sp. 210702-SL.1.03 TaxID=2883233 RepID=UPI001D06E361|nr:DNA polymerase I [Ruminococcus sp. 210702-SL.1.03]MCB6616547.1 DNA polymerase I [Ruminococcus sp. 210702-SL.1.03]